MSKIKLKIIIPLLVILILATGGFFYWKEYQKNKKLEETTVGEFFSLGILPKGFIINEVSEHKTLENKNLGINFNIPNGWNASGYMDDFIDLKSPDYKIDSITFDRLKGCLITMEVSYYTLFTSSNLINRINQIQKGNTQLGDGEVVEIDGHDALKIVTEKEWLRKEGIKEVVKVGIPFENSKAEVEFSTKIFESEINCIEEFNEFLETVSIQ